MIVTKEEIMKRYLRGDFASYHALANNYGYTSDIFWGMRKKGWTTYDTGRGWGLKSRAEKDMTGNGAWASEGGKEWYADLHEVLRTLGYVD